MSLVPMPETLKVGGRLPGPPRSVDLILEEILAELRVLSKTLRSDALRQEYYTTGEAAALLKCSAFTIRRWIKTGVLQAEKLGSGRQQDSYRIPKQSLIRMIETDPVALSRRRRISAAG